MEIIKTEKLDDNTKVVTSIIANQFALECNENVKHTTHYKRRLKQVLNPAITELIKAEPEFDDVYNQLEGQARQVTDVVRRLAQKLASLGIHHFDNVSDMVDAYEKDQKSIYGIVNKINR
jgi:hypothetical protein